MFQNFHLVTFTVMLTTLHQHWNKKVCINYSPQNILFIWGKVAFIKNDTNMQI